MLKFTPLELFLEAGRLTMTLVTSLSSALTLTEPRLDVCLLDTLAT